MTTLYRGTTGPLPVTGALTPGTDKTWVIYNSATDLVDEHVGTGAGFNGWSVTWTPGTSVVTVTVPSGALADNYHLEIDVSDTEDSLDGYFTVPSGGAPIPPTATLTASPTSIFAGDSSTLTYSTANADSASIDHGVGSVTPDTTGTRSVSPTVTTDYTLTATSGVGTASDDALVTIFPVGGDLAITGSNLTICPGQNATLNYLIAGDARGYTTGFLTNLTLMTGEEEVVIEAIFAESSLEYLAVLHLPGSLTLSSSGGPSFLPPLAATVYRLRLSGPGKPDVVHDFTVTVLPLPLVTLTASPNTINQGDSANLTFTSSNLSALSIVADVGISPGAVGLSGSISVSPTQTTRYTANGSGTCGTVDATADVVVTVIPTTPMPSPCDCNWTDADAPIDCDWTPVRDC